MKPTGVVRRLFLVSALVLLGGCAGSFGKGVRAYDHGLYPEALEQLRDVESDAARFSERDRARYALFRGLTHLALGDRAATEWWLLEAKRAIDANPQLLGDRETGRLASAWAHLATETPSDSGSPKALP